MLQRGGSPTGGREGHANYFKEKAYLFTCNRIYWKEGSVGKVEGSVTVAKQLGHFALSREPCMHTSTP